jgi:cell division protein FtsN
VLARAAVVCLIVLFGAFAFLAGMLAPPSVKDPLLARLEPLAASPRVEAVAQAVSEVGNGAAVTVPGMDALSVSAAPSNGARYALDGGLFASSTAAKSAAAQFQAQGRATTLVWLKNAKQIVVAVGSFETQAKALEDRSVLRATLKTPATLRVLLLPQSS